MGLVTDTTLHARISAGRPRAKGQRKKLNTAGRPTALELDRRLGLIIAVSTQLFVERGFAATSLVDIARAAGVATRTLYQHFGDKEAIFREVIYARDAGAALKQPEVLEGDTLFAALRTAGEYINNVTYRGPAIGLMRLMIAESTRFPEFMQAVATSIFGRFQRNVEKVFLAGEAAGIFPASDHARSAKLFFDLVLGSQPIMTYTNWDATPPTAEDLDERIELFILGRFGPTVARASRTRKAKLPKTC